MNKKDRRHSGRITPRLAGKPTMKYSEIKEEALEPQPFYDDWSNYRDGFRDWDLIKRKKRDKIKKKRKKRNRRRKL